MIRLPRWLRRHKKVYVLNLRIGGKAFLMTDLDAMKLHADFDGGYTAYKFNIPAPTMIELTITQGNSNEQR